MDEQKFNLSLRKFLKQVGITSQRALEDAAREASDAGKLKGRRTVKARMVLTVEAFGLTHTIEDEIPLE